MKILQKPNFQIIKIAKQWIDGFQPFNMYNNDTVDNQARKNLFRPLLMREF